MKREIVYVTADVGKYMTKCHTGSGDKFSMRTKYIDNNTMNLPASDGSYAIEYGGNKYIVGEQGVESNIELSKAKLVHKLSLYTALAKLTNEYESIRIILTCPPSIYKNERQREVYRTFMMGTGKENIVVDGVRRTLYIEDVEVFSEAAGLPVMLPNAFKPVNGNDKPLVGICDIGGLNMSFMVFKGFTLDVNSAKTSNDGGSSLETQVIDELNSVYGKDINKEKALQILKFGYTTRRGKVKGSDEVIRKVKERFVDGIVKTILSWGWDIYELDQMIFIGGTSNLLADVIKDKTDALMIEDTRNANTDSQWAAVEGIHKVGLARYLKKDKERGLM